MNFAEFVGFLVSMFALIFLFLRRSYQEQYRKEHPEEYAAMEQEREKALEEFFKGLEIEPPKREKPKPVPVRKKTKRSVGPQYRFDEKLESKIEDRHLVDHIAEEVRDITDRRVVSADLLMAQMLQEPAPPSQAKLIAEQSRQELFLSHEIFHRPRGLQPLIDANEFHLS